MSVWRRHGLHEYNVGTCRGVLWGSQAKEELAVPKSKSEQI